MTRMKVFEFISVPRCVKINPVPVVHSFSIEPFSIGMHVLIFNTMFMDVLVMVQEIYHFINFHLHRMRGNT